MSKKPTIAELQAENERLTVELAAATRPKGDRYTRVRSIVAAIFELPLDATDESIVNRSNQFFNENRGTDKPAGKQLINQVRQIKEAVKLVQEDTAGTGQVSTRQEIAA